MAAGPHRGFLISPHQMRGRARAKKKEKDNILESLQLEGIEPPTPAFRISACLSGLRWWMWESGTLTTGLQLRLRFVEGYCEAEDDND